MKLVNIKNFFAWKFSQIIAKITVDRKTYFMCDGLGSVFAQSGGVG